MNRLVSLLLIAGIIVLLNLLSKQFFTRWDITEDKEFTLSKATKEILRNLEEPVSVEAYFSEGLPAEYERLRRGFQETLVEYSNISKGNVDYQFINPNESPELEQQALQSGIQPLLINVREKDQTTQQKAFMGAQLSLGDQKEMLPFIGPNSPMEYDLTTAIKKMSVVDKPSVGFIEGHGEPGLNQLGQAVQALSVLYAVETLDLETEASIPDRFGAIAMLGPKDSIPQSHFDKIDDYLRRGGKMVLAVDAVTGDFSSRQGTEVPGTVVPWLAAKGLEIEPSFVVDASCGSVTVQQRQGFFTVNTPVQFPFLPVVKSFSDHPITKGLDQVILQFASPLRFLGDSLTFFTSIMESSEKSGIIRAPTFFNVADKKWSNADFPMSNISVGGVLEGNIGGGLPAKLIVFTDGDFAVGGEQGRGINPDNVNLLVNSLEWLSDETGLSELRTKGVATRPIKELEDGRRSFLKWLNFLLPILLVIGFGIFQSQRNRNKRIRRMTERYA